MPASWACVSPRSNRRVRDVPATPGVTSASRPWRSRRDRHPAGPLWSLADISRRISRRNGVNRRFFAIVDSLQDALLFKQIGAIDVVTAQDAAPRRTIVTTYTIDNDNNITAFGSAEEAAAATTTPFDSFGSQEGLAELAASWPAERLVAIWNSLPGVTPVKKFKDHKTAISRVWKRIQGLGEPEKPKANQPEKPKAERKA